MESEDYAFYQGLVYLLENNVEDLGYDITFSTAVGLKNFMRIRCEADILMAIIIFSFYSMLWQICVFWLIVVESIYKIIIFMQ